MDEAVRLESGSEETSRDILFSAVSPALQVPTSFSSAVNAGPLPRMARAMLLRNTDVGAVAHTFTLDATSLPGYWYVIDNSIGGGALTVGGIVVASTKCAIIACNSAAPTFVRITPDT